MRQANDMGFESDDELMPKKDDSIGFETNNLDLDNGNLEQTTTVRASRRRKREMPEVKNGIRHDRRQEDDGSDVITAPVRPVKRTAPADYTQPSMMREGSEFASYLFTDDEPNDSHMTSAFANRLDGLAYDEKRDGEGEQYDELFSQPQNVPMVKKTFNSRSKRARSESPAEEKNSSAADISTSAPLDSEKGAEKKEEKGGGGFASRFSKRKKEKNITPAEEEPKEEKAVDNNDLVSEKDIDVTDEGLAEDTEAISADSDSVAQPVPYPYPYGSQNPYGQYPPYPYAQQQYPYPSQYGYPPAQYPYPPQYAYPPAQMYAVMQPMGYIYQPGTPAPPAPTRRRRPTNVRSNARKYGQLPYDDQLPKAEDTKEEPKEEPKEERREESPAVIPAVDTPVTYAQTESEPKVIYIQPEVVYLKPEPPKEEPAPQPEKPAEPAPSPYKFNRRSRTEKSSFDAASPSDAAPPIVDDTNSAADKPKFNRRNRSSAGGQGNSSFANQSDTFAAPSSPANDAPASDSARPKFNRRSRG